MILLDILLVIVAMAIIAKGASWFVDSSVSIAEATHIPKAIIGATIVSFSTSFPEIAVSFMAALKGNAGLAVGNVVGSVTCNIGLAFGLVVAISTIPVHKKQLFLEQALIMVSVSIVLGVMCLFSAITFGMGLLMLSIFFGYMIYSVIRAMGERQQGLEQYLEEIETVEKLPHEIYEIRWQKQAILFILGAACIIGGSELLIHSGTRIAVVLGVSNRVIGLTLIALGTSLPELITCVAAAIKGHQDISFGSITGSNIIDITLAIGAAAMPNALPISSSMRFIDLPVMILLTVLMLIFGRTAHMFSRKEGITLVAIYLAFIISVFLMA